MIKLTNTDSNWDHYLNPTGWVESIAKCTGAGNSMYGPMSHFIRNLESEVINYEHLTPEGKRVVLEHLKNRRTSHLKFILQE